MWRLRGSSVEVVLVHRPKYDDWSIPKGKADSPEESDESCAIREIEEETGLCCRLETELAPVSYIDRQGRPKVVRYWVMQPVSGTAGPQNEVDEVRWLSVADARDLLSYDRDRSVLDEFWNACDEIGAASCSA